MKLKFVQNLYEADAARGLFLQTLDAAHKEIKSIVESKNYIFHDERDKGFYIKPKFGYLVKIRVEKQEDNFKIDIFDAAGESLGNEDLIISADKFMESWETAICSAAIKNIPGADKDEINQLKENVLNEFAPNIFKGIKNIIKGIKDKRDIKASSEISDIKNLITPCEDKLKDSLEAIGATNLKVSSKASGNLLEFEINGKFILGAGYELDEAVKIANRQYRIKVIKYVTNFGITKINCSLNTFIKFLNKKLNIDIELKDEKILKTTGSSDDQIKKASDFETKLKDTLGDEILNIIGESLNEALGEPVTDTFDKALEQIKGDAKKGASLVALYFYRQTNPKLKLSDEEAAELFKSIDAVKSFDVNKAPLFNIFVKYYRENKDTSGSNIGEELKNLIYLLAKKKIVKNLNSIDDTSLIYNAVFMGSDLDTVTSSDIYNKYNEIKNSTIKKEKLDTALTNIDQKNIDIPAKEDIKDAGDLANFMIFNNKKLRPVDEINKIFSAIKGRSNANYNELDDDDAEESDQLIGIDDDALKQLQGMFITDIKGINAGIDIEKLKQELTKPKNKKVKELMKHLLGRK